LKNAQGFAGEMSEMTHNPPADLRQNPAMRSHDVQPKTSIFPVTPPSRIIPDIQE